MQTLAYLGSLMRAETISNALIVCPKSVVRNWEREGNLILKRMCVPQCTIAAITSDVSKEKRKRLFTEAFCWYVLSEHIIIILQSPISRFAPFYAVRQHVLTLSLPPMD
jgi:hypothetical protein